MPPRQQTLLKRGDFRPKRYDVSREQLAAWRAAGEGTHKIAARYGCDQSTVRNWLIVFGLPTRLALIGPGEIPPGKVTLRQRAAPRTPPRPEDAADDPAVPEALRWAARLGFMIATRSWRRVWGPLPRETGCFMPRAVRVELASLILQQPEAVTLI